MDPVLPVIIVGSFILYGILSYIDKTIKKRKRERYVLESQAQIDKAIAEIDTDRLIEYLQFEETYEIAGKALKEIGQPAVETIFTVLQDPLFSPVRVHAEPVWTIIQDPNPALLVHVQAKSCSLVRVQATSILGEIGGNRAVEALIYVLRNPRPPANGPAQFVSDEEAVCRIVAAGALGEIGNSDAIESLFETAIQDPDSNVRVIAACALFKLGNPRALDALVESLQLNLMDLAWPYRAVGVSALGAIGDSKVIPLLIAHLAYWRDDVQIAAAEGLAGMGAPAFEALMALIANPEEKLRMYAFDALGRMGNLRALPKLERLAREDKNRAIRRAAKIAVEAIKQNQKAT
jgi:hypothetical protein